MKLLRKSPDFVSYVWLVKKVSIPESLKNKSLILSLGRIALSDRTFFNGVEIGATGYMPTKQKPLDYGFALKYSRNYYIPTNIVRFNKKNVIAVQVFSHIYSGFADPPFITSHFNWEKQCRIKDYLPVIQNLGVIIINILLFIILAYITENTKRFPFLIYPLILVLVSTFIHFLVMGLPFFENGLARFKLFFICFIIGALSVYLMIINFILKRKKVFFYIFSFISIISIVIIVYSPNTNFFVLKTLPIFFGYIGFCIISLFVPFVVRLIHNRLQYFYLCLMVLPLLLIIINSFFHILTFKVYQMPFFAFLFVPVILSNIIFYVIYDMKNNKSNNCIFIANNTESNQQNNKSKQKEIIYQIQQYLDSNYRREYNRIELAKQFNIHDNYMVQLFKKVTGTTISNYINTQRIRAAMQLIENGESRIIDIAYHIGFDSLTHFYRLFKKMTGMTPNEYRSRNRDCEDK
ncbi:MAG TPA: AraC family transcriptional regulator [Spirochaetota bacterium]|nr:AraC family transcriptional regulator [Spirochaetota bacterium]HPI88529.1 AraC family transcriptional regulator [Spirochaetota bacterium]HPR48009.1 AraC family transcriptional regulator [Spirochaetota bacterium]